MGFKYYETFIAKKRKLGTGNSNYQTEFINGITDSDEQGFYDKTLKNLMHYNTFDPIKSTYLIRRFPITYFKEKLKCSFNVLIDYIEKITKESTKTIDLTFSKEKVDSLINYLDQKYSIKKESFYLNPKYHKSSSKIDNKDLISCLEASKLKHFSLKDYSNTKGIKYSTLYNHTNKKLNFCYGKANYLSNRRLSQNISESKILFFIKFTELIEKDHFFIYIDECSFNLHKRISKIWHKKGESNTKYVPNRIKSVNLITSISFGGHIHSNYGVFMNNSITFKSFIEDLINKVKDNEQQNALRINGKITVLMDNACIHKSKCVRKMLLKNKVNILFFPPYNPEMNGSEFVFRRLKKKFYNQVLSSW